MPNSPAMGWQNSSDFGSDFNSQIFLIWSILSRISGAMPVQVKNVDSTARTVDIQPLINQLDGFGNAIPHGVIYGCPYFQLQSGNSAVIIPPTVNDIGVAIFADRDMSTVVETKAQANPGSNRKFDMADGIYFGGMLNGPATQFVEFLANGGGIDITSPGNVTINGVVFSPIGNITAPVGSTITAPNVVATTDITFGGKSGINHVHSGVTTGTGNTGAPV